MTMKPWSYVAEEHNLYRVEANGTRQLLHTFGWGNKGTVEELAGLLNVTDQWAFELGIEAGKKLAKEEN